MINGSIKQKEPIKCTLTKIMDDFTNSDINKEKCVNILKDYVYVPEKKIIA